MRAINSKPASELWKYTELFAFSVHVTSVASFLPAQCETNAFFLGCQRRRDCVWKKAGIVNCERGFVKGGPLCHGTQDVRCRGQRAGTTAAVLVRDDFDSNGPPRSDAPAPPPVFSALRPSRVVSSTSEEEEALTEKFLKINCKYITDGKGVVSGVLLVTPNNIMFDPHRTDPLVLERGCEEYGIMCPLDEVQSAAVYKEITDSKIRDSIPPDFEAVFSGSSHQTDQRLREGYDSASTAPRSTEGSISEDVFTESELSPIREERQSTEELQQEDKSSGASSQSVQTLLQESQSAEGSHTEEEEEKKPEQREPASETAQPKQPSQEQPSTPTSSDHQQPPHCQTEDSGSQSSAPGAGEATGQESRPDGAKLTRDGTRDSETDVEELRKMCMSHTMQQAKEQRESVQQAQRENDQESKSSQRLSSAEDSHLYIFIIIAPSFSAVDVLSFLCAPRSDHLYVFFIQWSPDVFGEGLGSISRDPGFVVVKKIEDSEANEEQQTDENSAKEWEVLCGPVQLTCLD
ncbi:oxidation resistance protein 1-like [Garra rufa]|uniref:oxidation resistance protein 1-like n=1 Tax=Garra rufa TaxID=137080 RepID=UPI003CCE7277